MNEIDVLDRIIFVLTAQGRSIIGVRPDDLRQDEKRFFEVQTSLLPDHEEISERYQEENSQHSVMGASYIARRAWLERVLSEERCVQQAEIDRLTALVDSMAADRSDTDG